MKSVLHSAKQNFTAQQFHAAQRHFTRPSGRISLKKARRSVLFSGDPPEIRLRFHPGMDEIYGVGRRCAAKRQSTGLSHSNFSNLQRKKADTLSGICFFGDPPEIRTPDPLLKRQLLCQLS